MLGSDAVLLYVDHGLERRADRRGGCKPDKMLLDVFFRRGRHDECTADVASSSAKVSLPADPTGGAVSASSCLPRRAQTRILELRRLRHRILRSRHLSLTMSSKHVSTM